MIKPERLVALRPAIAAAAKGAVEESHVRVTEAMSIGAVDNNEEAITALLIGLASAFHSACITYGHLHKTGRMDPMAILEATVEWNLKQMENNRKGMN